ncbi:MAG: PAS domain-containing protein, partial [Methanoregula sp.]|nr:PAS domain-containing protein [Methanoregula sp.]
PFDHEYRIILPGGDIRHILDRGFPLPDENGQITRYAGVAMDITERKRADEAQRQINKKLNLLYSITRHDILNQLMGLQGYIMLSRGVIDKPEKLLEFIKKEQQAANTIEEQIKFTKDYQNLGVATPTWQKINDGIIRATARLPWVWRLPHGRK